jgi:hypothetical protein
MVAVLTRGDRLSVRGTVSIGGREYHFGPGKDAPGQPIRLEIEHRDNEASRLGLTVWERLTDTPFPEFNTVPDPECNPTIPVEAHAGWEGEGLVKLFGGLLIAKLGSYQLSQTKFVAIHDAHKLRKRARVKTFKGLTVKELLVKLAAEEGITLQVDASAAGDAALNTPTEVMYQLGEANWPMMLRYIHALGYVTNTIKKNVMVLRWNKESGAVVVVRRGDGQILDWRIRQEQKKAGRAPKYRGHAHEAKAGKFGHRNEGKDCGGGQTRVIVPAPIAKKKTEHKLPPARFSVKQTARRQQREGAEMDFKLRFVPTMRNEEIIRLSGFGPQIDGDWETSAVTHTLGGGAHSTDASCWRQQR